MNNAQNQVHYYVDPIG